MLDLLHFLDEVITEEKWYANVPQILWTSVSLIEFFFLFNRFFAKVKELNLL